MNGADIDVSLAGLPKEEDWIFYAPFGDKSLIRNTLIYSLSNNMGRYASRSKFMEVNINEDYKGVYSLFEKIKVDKHRVNISKTLSEKGNETGYILKIDKPTGEAVNSYNDYNDQMSFLSNYDPYGNYKNNKTDSKIYFVYHYPKPEDISIEQKDFIRSLINEFEDVLISDNFNDRYNGYRRYIDIDSFVDYFILNELTGNIDAYRLSTYMHKNRGGKLKMGPIWDLNIGYNRQDRVPFTDWIANYNQYVPRDAWMVPFWWKVFLGDDYFKQRLKERWTQYRSNQFSNQTVLNLVQETADYLIENGSIDRNYQRWIGISIDYLQVIDALKNHLQDRLLWMDQKIYSM